MIGNCRAFSHALASGARLALICCAGAPAAGVKGTGPRRHLFNSNFAPVLIGGPASASRIVQPCDLVAFW